MAITDSKQLLFKRLVKERVLSERISNENGEKNKSEFMNQMKK
jgi:hypothetical protein